MLGTLSWTALDRGLFASIPTASVAIATLQTLCLATSLLQFGAYESAPVPASPICARLPGLPRA
jgi:hypothetical protein